MTAETVPLTRRFSGQTRIASKPYTCSKCSGRIEKGEPHLTHPERVGRKLHTRRSHYLCPIPERPVIPETGTSFPIPISRSPLFSWPVVMTLVFLGLVLAALALAASS